MQINCETIFFKDKCARGVFITSLGFQHRDVLSQLLPSSSFCLSSAGHSLPVNTPLSEFWSCAQAHCSPLGMQACPGCRCSMPLPSSCLSCILADAVFRASPEGPLPSQKVLGGGCQGLGSMKGKKSWRAKCLEIHSVKHAKENQLLS